MTFQKFYLICIYFQQIVGDPSQISVAGQLRMMTSQPHAAQRIQPPPPPPPHAPGGPPQAQYQVCFPSFCL